MFIDAAGFTPKNPSLLSKIWASSKVSMLQSMWNSQKFMNHKLCSDLPMNKQQWKERMATKKRELGGTAVCQAICQYQKMRAFKERKKIYGITKLSSDLPNMFINCRYVQQYSMKSWGENDQTVMSRDIFFLSLKYFWVYCGGLFQLLQLPMVISKEKAPFFYLLKAIKELKASFHTSFFR